MVRSSSAIARSSNRSSFPRCRIASSDDSCVKLRRTTRDHGT
jgi:hypothetical protein